MDGFISWQMLATFGILTSVVYMVVEFTKEMKWIKDIKTKYWSAIIAFVLIVLSNIHNGKFTFWDVILYFLSAILIALAGKGLADWNKPKQ